MGRILKISQEAGGTWQVGCQKTENRTGVFHYGHRGMTICTSKDR